MIEAACSDVPVPAIVPFGAAHVEEASGRHEPVVEFQIMCAGDHGLCLIHQRRAHREIGMKADAHRRRLSADVLYREGTGEALRIQAIGQADGQ